MEIIKVNKNNFDEAVNKAVEVLVSGGVSTFELCDFWVDPKPLEVGISNET